MTNKRWRLTFIFMTNVQGSKNIYELFHGRAKVFDNLLFVASVAFASLCSGNRAMSPNCGHTWIRLLGLKNFVQTFFHLYLRSFRLVSAAIRSAVRHLHPIL